MRVDSLRKIHNMRGSVCYSFQTFQFARNVCSSSPNRESPKRHVASHSNTHAMWQLQTFHSFRMCHSESSCQLKRQSSQYCVSINKFWFLHSYQRGKLRKSLIFSFVIVEKIVPFDSSNDVCRFMYEVLIRNDQSALQYGTPINEYRKWTT